MKIRLDDVREERITNKSVRLKSFDITNIEIQIAKRRLHFVGRIVRVSDDKVPVRLISAWIKKTRPICRPNLSIDHSILNDIRKIISTVDDDGDLDSWAHVALEKLTWSMLVNSLGYNNNFEYKEWNYEFRKNYIPPPITPPKESTSPQNSSSSPNPPPFPNFSSPPHRNQSSQRKCPPTARNSTHSPPPAYNPKSDEVRIIKISVSSS